MASRWAELCDAVLADLTTNVTALTDATPHRLAPWDAEVLQAEPGEKHIAVYLAAEAAEEAAPLVTGPGGDIMVDLYRVLYWEDAGDESSRGIADEAAAETLYELMAAVIDRFYVLGNLRIGGTELTKYVGLSLPERSSTVRWFQVTLRARRSLVVS